MRRAISLAKSISIFTRMSQFAHFGGRFQFGAQIKMTVLAATFCESIFFFSLAFHSAHITPKNLKIFLEKMIHHQCPGSSVKKEIFHCTTAFIFSLSIKGTHYGVLIIFLWCWAFLIVSSWCNVLFLFCFSICIFFIVSCCFKWSSLCSVLGGGGCLM